MGSAAPSLATREVAASWCKHNEISAAALREVGVAARVLAKAGL
jgi:hypothetical protein